MHHKYWLYKTEYSAELFFSGSSSVIDRVYQHFEGVIPFNQNEVNLSMEQIIAQFAVDKYVFGKFDNQPGNRYQTRPYEWANPPDLHEELIGRKKGVCPGQVYSISYNRTKVQSRDQCVLTYHQYQLIDRPDIEWLYSEEKMTCEKYTETYLH